MSSNPFAARLGLNVPSGWWPSAQLLKGFEAGGFAWAQIPSPPEDILCSPRECLAHARAAAQSVASTELQTVVHAPGELRVGSRAADRCFEGLLAYAGEIGAQIVVYHARNLEDGPATEDAQLAETRSLAKFGERAEQVRTSIALENLAPFYPGPERLSHSPRVLRTLANRLSSPAIGLCLDLGHAHVVSDLRHSDITELVDPVLDSVVLFHVHDNLGARRGGHSTPELDPLRLDLHLAPGRGTLDWSGLTPQLRRHGAPLMLEVHPPHRGSHTDLLEATLKALGAESQVIPAA